jgi:hypothetical protein
MAKLADAEARANRRSAGARRLYPRDRRPAL